MSNKSYQQKKFNHSAIQLIKILINNNPKKKTYLSINNNFAASLFKLF